MNFWSRTVSRAPDAAAASLFSRAPGVALPVRHAARLLAAAAWRAAPPAPAPPPTHHDRPAGHLRILRGTLQVLQCRPLSERHINVKRLLPNLSHRSPVFATEAIDNSFGSNHFRESQPPSRLPDIYYASSTAVLLTCLG
ncbi:hypothetical protein ACJJTC_005588 [Scirpophaga incertulas]